MTSPNLFELLLYILFRENPGFGSKHICKLLLAHANLVANGHEPVGKIHVILLQELHCHHEPIDFVKDKCPSGTVRFL